MTLDSNRDSNGKPTRSSGVVAAIALGLLVGFSCGLSASSIGPTLLAALMSVGAVVMQVTPKPRPAPFHARAVTGFSVATLIAMVGGVYVRSHEVLAPRVAPSIEYLLGQGYSPEQALSARADTSGALVAGSVTVPAVLAPGPDTSSTLDTWKAQSERPLLRWAADMWLASDQRVEVGDLRAFFSAYKKETKK